VHPHERIAAEAGSAERSLSQFALRNPTFLVAQQVLAEPKACPPQNHCSASDNDDGRVLIETDFVARIESSVVPPDSGLDGCSNERRRRRHS
jgi:hypothetical protein